MDISAAKFDAVKRRRIIREEKRRGKARKSQGQTDGYRSLEELANCSGERAVCPSRTPLAIGTKIRLHGKLYAHRR